MVEIHLSPLGQFFLAMIVKYEKVRKTHKVYKKEKN
jgi:hypothetical protein